MYTDYFADMPEITKPQLSLFGNTSSSTSLGTEYPQMPPSPTTPDSGFASHTVPRCSSRINLAGSWLDLESDDEDSSLRTTLRMRRKNSGASAKDATIARSPMANIRELTHRSTLRIRKLTDKMTR
ncbi:hypothetical protein IWW56_003949 [Coemansia sp. RSA 2131]|nr:hypothetical protein LPJ76_005642 [Coemansia sp. RSA 638]KAJ2478088.1 hypothetical protein IWW56_003949 [Coemansia sp. RSA 2131]